MAPPVKSVGNVLVGISNMYLGPANQAGPAETLAFNEAWLAPWVHPGYSDKGLTLMFDRKEKRHQVEEVGNPVVITVESSTLKIQFGFAEATLQNLKYAMGGGAIATVAAGTGIAGKNTLTLSEDLEVLALGFEGKNPMGFWRRVVIPRVVSTGKLKTEFDRSKNKQVYTAEFESICPMAEISITEKTANATA